MNSIYKFIVFFSAFCTLTAASFTQEPKILPQPKDREGPPGARDDSPPLSRPPFQAKGQPSLQNEAHPPQDNNEEPPLAQTQETPSVPPSSSPPAQGKKEEKKEVKRKEPKVPTISLDVKDMNIVDVLKILSEQGKFNISVSNRVKGRVTLFLKDVDVWEALKIAVASAGLAYEKRKGIIYIMTDREYQQTYGSKYEDKRKVEGFSLKYANASKVRNTLSPMLSSVGKVSVDNPTNTLVIIDIPQNLERIKEIIKVIDRPFVTEVFSLNYVAAKDLEQRLSQIITKETGSLKIDEFSNKVIVTDYPGKIEEIKKLINAFDEQPPQVLIDAKIIELKPSKKYYSGIEWEYWFRKHFSSKGSFSIPSTLGEKVSFGTIGATVDNFGDYSGVIEFLQTFGETKILSSPRIMVLNNQEAKILVGTKDVYITSSVSEIGDEAVTTQTINFVDVGVKLFVTPTINRKGFITMKIRPEISSAERETITSEDKGTQVPIVSTSEAETTVMVKDGVTIIIGGLKQVQSGKESKKVPVLGSIPFLGVFFRNRSDEWNKSELIIILTPHIIHPDISSSEIAHVKETPSSIRGNFEKKREPAEEQEEKKQREKIPPLPKKSEKKEEVLSSKKRRGPIIYQGKKELHLPGGPEEKQEDTSSQANAASLKSPPPEPSSNKLPKKKIETASLPKKKSEETLPSSIEEEKGIPPPKETDTEQPAKPESSSTEEELPQHSLDITEKIKSVIASLKNQKKGKIKVRFSLSPQGNLIGEPIVLFASDESLKALGKHIIKKSSPFSPLPEDYPQTKQNFEIVITLE